MSGLILQVPVVRFSNLNLDLSLNGITQLEIVNCTVSDLVVNDIIETLILDNVQIGTQDTLKAWSLTSDLTSKEAMELLRANIFIDFRNRQSSQVVIRNSHFIGCSLYVGSTYTNGTLKIENSLFEYSVIDFTNGLVFTASNVPRPFLYVEGSNFTRSTIQLLEVGAVDIVNSQFNHNIPEHIGNFLYSKTRLTHIFAALTVMATEICSVYISESIFSNSQSIGAVYMEGTGVTAVVEYSHFHNNCNTKGGAAITLQTIYKMAVSYSLFERNKQISSPSEKSYADEKGGGAILQYQSLLITDSCYFINNEATTGGAILSLYAHKYRTFNGIFKNNSAVYGGAYAAIDLTYSTTFYLSDTTFESNSASKYGGAIFTLKSILDMGRDNLITNNYAKKAGGGAYTVGIRRVSDNTLESQCTDNHSGNGSVSNHDAFPEIISVRIPGKQYVSMSNNTKSGNNTNNILETSFGEKVVIFLDLFDNSNGKGIDTVNSITEMELSVQTKPSNQVFELHETDSTLVDGILYSRSHIGTYNTNGTLTFTFKSSLFKTGTFSTQIDVPITPITCQPWFSLQSDAKKIVNGDFAYSCQFNTPLIIPFILIAVFSVGLIVVSIISVVCFKFYGMKSKIKILHKKEQAEEELTQRLLDLQSLYTSELESKYSIKNWLIKIDDIKVVKKIGEGGMGVVYLAFWKNVEVALKSIKLEEDDMDTTEFEHESSMLSSIRHPNIVNFYGVVLADQSKFMVTEYMNGGCLEKLIYDCKLKKKHLNLREKVSILIGVANGMSYLHGGKDNCIIHRDLKPGNILLSNDLTPKVCDFGLSRLSNESSNTTKTGNIGTLLYMSPEILLENITMKNQTCIVLLSSCGNYYLMKIYYSIKVMPPIQSFLPSCQNKKLKHSRHLPISPLFCWFQN